MNSIIQEADQQFVSVYNRYPIILDHGEGMYLFDVDGKRYLDFGSGIGVCGLGYHDPNYTHMLQAQIEKLVHTSNLFYNVPAVEAAKRFNQASHHLCFINYLLREYRLADKSNCGSTSTTNTFFFICASPTP